jgi:glycosyltransferase involved in cell wall biosynthesis
MKVLIFHGYLLRGTGSNVYNANVAQALARLGHDVHLLCQDREAAALGWVDAVGDWDGGALEVRAVEAGRGQSPGAGSITAYTPDIGGLLPVYVEDRYAGFRVKAFPALSEAELDSYIAANVSAVGDVAEAAGGIDAALANHLVMGPLILARSGLPYAAKVHGSALSYTVRPHPRFLPHATEGMEGASAVLVGSRHTATSLWETLPELGLEAKTRLGPPGVDIEAFAPRPPERSAVDALAAAAERIAASAEEGSDEASFGRDPAGAVRALTSYAAGPGPRVVFVGKLIVSKGADLLLAAWPLVVAAHPGARLLMAGFGAYRAALEDLWAAIASGDVATAREIAARGRGLEDAHDGDPAADEPLPILSAFLADPPAGWLEACAPASGTVSFPGRLEHDEVAEVLIGSDAMVVPSTFPEAFGMVAAEAAATGALPVCADHSGLAEVAAALDAELPEAARGLTAFPLDDGAVEGIAERLNAWLGLPAAERVESAERMAATVRRLWSWEGVAAGVIDASAGRLDSLTPIPPPSPDQH